MTDYSELKDIGAAICIMGLMWMAGPYLMTFIGMALFLWADFKDDASGLN